MAKKIEDAVKRMPDLSDGRLRFEGSVELAGTVTPAMLGTLFGPDSVVDGRLEFAGPVTVDGTFRGSITTGDTLVIGGGAVIDAEVACGSATIHGTVNGNITAKEAVALEPSARVHGDITAPALSVAKGASFDGISRMGSSAKSRR